MVIAAVDSLPAGSRVVGTAVDIAASVICSVAVCVFLRTLCLFRRHYRHASTLSTSTHNIAAAVNDFITFYCACAAFGW